MVQSARKVGQPAAQASPADTSLDPIQKSGIGNNDDSPSQNWRFRHSPNLRAWLLDHINLWESNYKKVTRFRLCGTRAFVEYSPSTDDYRVTASHCGNRICPACRRAYARRTADKLTALFQAQRKAAPLFMTLTLRPSKAELGDVIQHLKAFFKRLRGTGLWKSTVRYGVAFVEATRGAKGLHWHAHLHIIAWGKFIPQAELAKTWSVITHGSYIVDVRRVSSSADVQRYVTGYLTKPPPDAVLSDDQTAQEWYRAVQRSHWVIRFGSRKLAALAEPKSKVTDWERVCSLDTLLRLHADLPLYAAARQVRVSMVHAAAQELTDYVLDSC